MAFEHTTRAFDDDLQELTRLVAEMGGLAERQIVESLDALIRRDTALGARVVALDSDFQPLKLIRGLEHMTDLVQSQVKSVLDAYASHDLPAAMGVWKGDEEVDAICTSLFRELLTYMMEDPRNIGFCIHLMFCAKNIERIGDHATNIAETVFYMIEGQQMLDKRPKGDMTGFASAVPGN
jgi:phosphate transport system protein